jgi:hypothetical protein
MMPSLEHAIGRYATMIREADFAAEAAARDEGAPETHAVRRGQRIR